MKSPKITVEHLRRRSIVYVRQSTPHQVQDNLESQRRQYALADMAREMGFAAVAVIDDDLGRSGAGHTVRPGFERLFADLTTREVGAIFCLEASRLARNGREWHTLLDMCAVVEAVIVDPEGVYDPRVGNDRLLLGLKGTLSEYELTLLRQRALSAIREKAARGELRFVLPVGLCWTRDGRIELSPDLRVQEAVRLVYRKYAELGSMRKVLLWFHEKRMTIPVRRFGPCGDEVEWEMPVGSTIHRTLTSPFYAGAYAWGRTAKANGPAKTWACKPLEEWEVLLIDHHPGYISWQEYLQIQRNKTENAHMVPWKRKAGRGGRGLLAGLLRCRRCGHRLRVRYSGKGHPSYLCGGTGCQDGGKCIAFSGVHVDAAISAEVLRAVEEPAVSAALLAAESVGKRREEECKSIELELEQARYRAGLAERRYERTDPENRLVAPELERRWNAALAEVATLEVRLEEHRRNVAAQPVIERERLLQLAKTLPTIWHDETVDMQTKQRVVRILVEEIIADVDLENGQVILLVHWAGGRHSEIRAKRRRPDEHRLKTSLETSEVIRRMGAYWDDRRIAITLNRLGMKTATGLAWTEGRVLGFRSKHGMTGAVLALQAQREPVVTLIEAAHKLTTDPITIRKLIEAKILPAEQIVPFAPWRIPVAALTEPKVLEAVAARKARRPQKRPKDTCTLMIPTL